MARQPHPRRRASPARAVQLSPANRSTRSTDFGGHRAPLQKHLALVDNNR